MKCPKCKLGDTRVYDTRLDEQRNTIRRRRRCIRCGHRFTTYETDAILDPQAERKRIAQSLRAVLRRIVEDFEDEVL